MNLSLQYFEEKTKNCKSGAKKEEFELRLERCREVYNNINIIEMELLWYIRHSKKYNMHGYLIVAKKIYEAELALEELINAAYNAELDKK